MAKRRGNQEGSIYKRPNGKWQVQASFHNERLSKTCRTRAECLTWLQDMSLQKRQGLSLSGNRLTYSDYLQSWLKDAKLSVKFNTWYQYEGVVRNHIDPEIGYLSLKDIKPEELQALYSRKRASGISLRTIALIHAVIRRSLNIAKMQGLISSNPAHSVVKPKEPKTEMKVLLETQGQKLLSAAHGKRIEGIIVLALTTGLRQGEILGLKWEDLDWVNYELQIKRQLQRVPGQGFVFSQPKTKSGVRKIKLGVETIKALEKHLDLQSFERNIAGDKWQDQGLIFTSTIGTPFEQKKLHDQYKELLKEASLPDMRFHDLRHTAASLMLLNGIPVIVVSKRLGHAKVSTTLDIYGHYMPGMQDEAAHLMDSLVIPTAADCSRVPQD